MRSFGPFLHVAVALIALCNILVAVSTKKAAFTAPETEVLQEVGRLKVVLDCDPGVDDVLALWWLASAEQQGIVDLLAVTTVAGNAGGRTAFRNAVIATKFHALLRDKDGIQFGKNGQDASENPSDGFFGGDGMSNLSELMLEAAMPDRGLDALIPDFDSAPESAELLVKVLLENEPESVTIIAVGPLTNLAKAEEISPGILSRAREVVIMGGGFGFHGPHAGVDGYSARGNVKTMAEFNFWADAGSAEKVFNSAKRASHAPDIVLVPLDVTQQLCLTYDQNEQIAKAVDALTKNRLNHAAAAKAPNVVVHLLSEMVKRLEEPLVERAQRCLYLHDPAAVGFLLYPQLFHLRKVQVSVGTEGPFTGHSYTDLRPNLQGPSNAFVAGGVEKAEFLMALRRDISLLAVEKALEATDL